MFNLAKKMKRKPLTCFTVLFFGLVAGTIALFKVVRCWGVVIMFGANDECF